MLITSNGPTRRRNRRGRCAVVAMAVAGLLLALLPSGAIAGPGAVQVQILSLTDLHGYLSANDNQTIAGLDGKTLKVGGAAYIKAHLDQLRDGRPNSFLIGSGDQFSGWPDYTQGFANEPTIEVLNAFGLDFDVPGNHEFDREFPFLQRMMSGDCYEKPGFDSCFPDSTGRPFHGTDYRYHAANIHQPDTGDRVLAPYWITQASAADGTQVPIGFIGLTLPSMSEESLSVTAGGFELEDLVTGANRAAAELKEQGVESIVVSVHDGGEQQGHFNECRQPSGRLFDAAAQMSPDIDAILGGHWHTAFNCMIPDPDGNPRPVLEASNHGRLVGEINLAIDPTTGDVIRAETTASNHPMTKDIAPDPEVKGIVDSWVARWATRQRKPLSTITSDIAFSSSKESSMSNLVADLYWTEAEPEQEGHADFALLPADQTVNVVGAGLTFDPGQDPRDHPGRVLFGEAWPVAGISPITTLELTGATIDAVLEEQWLPPAYGCQRSAHLAVSKNVRYRADLGRPVGDRVDPSEVLINGRPLKLDQTYRVATSSIMPVSGSLLGYPSFEKYDDLVRSRLMGQEVFLNYLRTHRRINAPAADRVSLTPGTPPPVEGPFGPLNFLPQDEMTAVSTSQGSGAYAAKAALDGNCSTMWHSAWSPYAPLPQSITVDLGESRAIEALVYTPRQDAEVPNGRIRSYQVQTSSDATSFETVATGSWDGTVDVKIARLPAGTSTRYVRLVGLEGGADFAAATEINIALGSGQ